MGIKVYINDLSKQSESIKLLVNKYGDAYANLEKVVNYFVENKDSFQGESYDAARNYFDAVYLPLSRGMRMLCEELETVNHLLVVDYKKQVCSHDLDEELLEAQMSMINAI